MSPRRKSFRSLKGITLQALDFATNSQRTSSAPMSRRTHFCSRSTKRSRLGRPVWLPDRLRLRRSRGRRQKLPRWTKTPRSRPSTRMCPRRSPRWKMRRAASVSSQRRSICRPAGGRRSSRSTSSSSRVLRSCSSSSRRSSWPWPTSCAARLTLPRASFASC